MGRGHSSPPTLQGGSMRSSSFQVQLRAVLVIFAACFAFTVARGQNPTHVINGTVEKVDAGAKTIALKTADGTVETVKFTEKTTVHGHRVACKGGDLVEKEGGYVLAHTTGEGGEKAPHPLDWSGKKPAHTTEGAVEVAGRGRKPGAEKAADGTKEAFEVSEH